MPGVMVGGRQCMEAARALLVVVMVAVQCAARWAGEVHGADKAMSLPSAGGFMVEATIVTLLLSWH